MTVYHFNRFICILLNVIQMGYENSFLFKPELNHRQFLLDFQPVSKDSFNENLVKEGNIRKDKLLPEEKNCTVIVCIVGFRNSKRKPYQFCYIYFSVHGVTYRMLVSLSPSVCCSLLVVLSISQSTKIMLVSQDYYEKPTQSNRASKMVE